MEGDIASHPDRSNAKSGVAHYREAREHLTTATAMYRDMDMRFWLEKAEEELADRS